MKNENNEYLKSTETHETIEEKVAEEPVKEESSEAEFQEAPDSKDVPDEKELTANNKDAESIIPESYLNDENNGKSSNAGKLSKWGEKTVTRKFAALAIAAAVLFNAAVTTGVMAHYSKKIADNTSSSFRSGRPGSEEFYGGGRGGRGQMMPPDMNGDFGNSPKGRNSQNQNSNTNNGQESSQQLQNQSGPSIGIVIREDSGVYISQITGEKAKAAGFKEGDKIVSADGKNISASNDLITVVQSHKAGDSVTVKVERNGQEMEIKTELE